MLPITPVNLSNPEALLGAMQEMGPGANIAAPRTGSVDSLSFGGGVGRVGATTSGKGIAPTFANFLKDAVAQVSDKMNVAEAEKQKILTGESGNIHQAMIAMQESSIAFTLMIEVRNKLVESYQELMRMQV